MDAKELLQTIADKVQARASVKTIVGEPIHAEGKTIVPIARVAYGFGGGAGWGRDSNGAGNGYSHTDATQYDAVQDTESVADEAAGKEAGSGGGGGGGGGLQVSPVGVLEITSESTRFIGIGFQRRFLAALLLGVAAGFLAGRFTSASR